MPELNQKFFRGSEEIPQERAETLACKGSGEKAINDTLTELGWEGNLITAVLLTLSNDGEKAKYGELLVRGLLGPGPITTQASKLWEACDKDIILTIQVPKGEAFSFDNGSLASGYIGEEEVEFQFTQGNTVIPKEQWEEKSIGNFSLKLMAHLGRASNGASGPHLQFTLLAYPLNIAQLSEMAPATDSPAWPGIKVMEGQSGFFPMAPSGFWGAPFFPLLDIGDRAASCGKFPRGAELRYAIAALMNTAVLPTACTNHAGLKKQCRAMVENPELTTGREPTITWPMPERPEPEQGRTRWPIVVLII